MEREGEEKATVCKWLMLTLSYILLILSVLFFSCLQVEVLWLHLFTSNKALLGGVDMEKV